MKEKLFTGEKPMDEDGTDTAALHQQRIDNRAAAAAAAAKDKQQKSGKGGAARNKKGEEIIVEDCSDKEATVISGKGGQPGRSCSHSRTRGDDDESTVMSD